MLTLKKKLLNSNTVRTTLPCERGKYNLNLNSPSPWTGYIGEARLRTQCDVVARHDDGSASLVQVHMCLPPAAFAVSNSGEVEVELREEEHPHEGFVGTNEVNELMLSKYGCLMLIRDMYDNLYYAPLVRTLEGMSAGPRTAKFDLFGGCVARMHLPEWFSPAPQQFADRTPEILPYFGGLNVFAKVHRDTDLIEWDVMWHNGGAEDPLGPLFYKSISVLIHEDWDITSRYPMPKWQVADGGFEGYNRVFLKAPRTDKRLYTLHPNKQLHFRFCATMSGLTAIDCVEDRGWASDPVLWNQGEKRYGVEDFYTPRFDHMDEGSIVTSRMMSTLGRFGQGLNGSPMGGDNLVDDDHYWGPSYGGATGGLEKDFFQGAEAIASSNSDELRYLRMRGDALMHRMDDNAIMAADGECVDLRPFHGDDTPWKVFDGWQNRSYPNKQASADAPWDFYFVFPLSDVSQRDTSRSQLPNEWNGGNAGWRVDSSDYRRGYFTTWDTWNDGGTGWGGVMRIDYQHLCRVTGPLQAAVYLDNDPLAKLSLKQVAMNSLMAYWPYGNGRLASRASGDGRGTDLGRGPAHAVHSMIIAWQFMTDDQREQYEAVWTSFLSACESNRMPFGSGNTYKSGKTTTYGDFDGAYSVTRSNEESWRHICLWAIGRAMPHLTGRVKQILESEIGIAYFDHCWAKEQDGSLRGSPWTHVATGVLNNGQQFNAGEHPSEQYTAGRGSFGMHMTLAVAVMAGINPPKTKDRVQRAIGQDPITALKNKFSEWGVATRYALLGALEALENNNV